METQNPEKMEKELVGLKAVLAAVAAPKKAFITDKETLVHLINRVEGNFNTTLKATDKEITEKMTYTVRPPVIEQLENYGIHEDSLLNLIEEQGDDGAEKHLQEKGWDLFDLWSIRAMKEDYEKTGGSDTYKPEVYELENKEKYIGIHFFS